MNTYMRQAFGLMVITAGLIAAAASLALAHHSTAPFDSTTQKTLTGTVKQLEWTNPHTWIWVNVPNDKNGTDLWGVEGMSPNYLARRGWNKATLKPGDKISIIVRPMKDGSKAGMFVTATLADGTILRQTGNPTDPD